MLSNDRFSEYRDKPAVREKRLITHEILNGQILVHDLDISLPFGPQRLTETTRHQTRALRSCRMKGHVP